MTHKFEIYASNDSTSRLDFIGEVQATDYRNAVKVATKKFGKYKTMAADLEKWNKVDVALSMGLHFNYQFIEDSYQELEIATRFLQNKGIIQ